MCYFPIIMLIMADIHGWCSADMKVPPGGLVGKHYCLVGEHLWDTPRGLLKSLGAGGLGRGLGLCLLQSGAVSCQDWNVSKNLALVVYTAHLKPWDIVITEYFKHMWLAYKLKSVTSFILKSLLSSIGTVCHHCNFLLLPLCPMICHPDLLLL